MDVKLFSFWRSLATFRVRIALNLKGITPEVVEIRLDQGDQHSEAYRAINPEMVLPALIDDNAPPLFQSLAIIEYLDECYPTPPLLPTGARARARVRGLAQVVACDHHPLIVPRVRSYLEKELNLDEETRLAWCRHWFNEGLRTLETHLARDKETGRYCHGERVSLADLCLVSHAVGAKIFNCDTSPYPTVQRIVTTCLEDENFAKAHPLKQPGAPEKVVH